MTEEHRNRVLEHQQIAQLFSCSLEELFAIYQQTEPEDDDTSWMRLIYSIGSWRFGARAWSNRHTEYFKERARQNAAAGGGEAAKESPSEKWAERSSPLPTLASSWQQKLDALKGSGIILDLPTLIALAHSHTLAHEELQAIRKAWVVRELQQQQPQLKKNRAEALYEEAKRKVGL